MWPSTREQGPSHARRVPQTGEPHGECWSAGSGTLLPRGLATNHPGALLASPEATAPYRAPVCCCSRYGGLQPIRLPQLASQICRESLSSVQAREVTPMSAFPHTSVHTRCSHFSLIHVAVDTLRPSRPTTPVRRGSRVMWYGNANFHQLLSLNGAKTPRQLEHIPFKRPLRGLMPTHPQPQQAYIYIL